MALAAASAVVFALFLRTRFLTGIPLWVRWERSAFSDRTGMYAMELNNRIICVRYDTKVVWTSPKEVKVQRALSCDIDNDGADELVLLCWKKGRYGAHRPFWVEEDEDA